MSIKKTKKKTIHSNIIIIIIIIIIIFIVILIIMMQIAGPQPLWPTFEPRQRGACAALYRWGALESAEEGFGQWGVWGLVFRGLGVLGCWGFGVLGGFGVFGEL